MERKTAKKEATAAKRRQEAAWTRWQASDSAADQAAWSKAVDDQRAAEDRAADEKLATLDMVLKSDSGFRSSSKGDRISTNQWRDIMLVIADAEAYRKMRAADDMLAAMEMARICLCNTERDLKAKSAIDAAIAKATGGAS